MADPIMVPLAAVSALTADDELRRIQCMLCDETLLHVKQHGCTERAHRRVCRWSKALRSQPTASDSRHKLSEHEVSDG